MCVSVFPEYIAMYTYESSEQGDLTFQQGDVILVIKKEGDWWTGATAGRTGVFPSNYVRPRDSEVGLTFTGADDRLITVREAELLLENQALKTTINNYQHCYPQCSPCLAKPPLCIPLGPGLCREDGEFGEEAR